MEILGYFPPADPMTLADGSMLHRVAQIALSISGRISALVLMGSLVVFVGGCNTMDLRGGSFPHDETFEWPAKTRAGDGEIECFGFSNKACEIEQSCGARARE